MLLQFILLTPYLVIASSAALALTVLSVMLGQREGSPSSPVAGAERRALPVRAGNPRQVRYPDEVRASRRFAREHY